MTSRDKDGNGHAGCEDTSTCKNPLDRRLTEQSWNKQSAAPHTERGPCSLRVILLLPRVCATGSLPWSHAFDASSGQTCNPPSSDGTPIPRVPAERRAAPEDLLSPSELNLDFGAGLPFATALHSSVNLSTPMCRLTACKRRNKEYTQSHRHRPKHPCARQNHSCCSRTKRTLDMVSDQRLFMLVAAPPVDAQRQLWISLATPCGGNLPWFTTDVVSLQSPYQGPGSQPLLPVTAGWSGRRGG